MMNQPISIEKIFEMYGRVSLERDMLAEENQKLKHLLDENNKAQADKEKKHAS
jgi:cell shape-determining protein MreC